MSPGSKKLQVWEAPATKPLDERAWQAWIAKGRADERRSAAAYLKVVKWALIAVLLLAALLGSHLTPYQVVVRFMVAAGSIVVMLPAIHKRQYAVAAVFAALVVLYNPAVPVLTFSGGWQRALVAASALPFVAALGAHKTRVAQHA